MGVRSGITPAILAIWEAEAAGSGDQTQPQLHPELKAGLGHIVDPVLESRIMLITSKEKAKPT